MPSPETLEHFIARVESNAHVEAILEFYAEHASMQENLDPPRRGREALVANEQRALSMAKSVYSECVRPVFVNGDHVVIRWIFEFPAHDTSVPDIEELSYQGWEGDRIVQEQSFYDRGQFPRRPR